MCWEILPIICEGERLKAFSNQNLKGGFSERKNQHQHGGRKEIKIIAITFQGRGKTKGGGHGKDGVQMLLD